MLLDLRPAHPSSLLDQKLRDRLGFNEAFEGEGYENCSSRPHGQNSPVCNLRARAPGSVLLSLLFLGKCQDSYVEHLLGTTEELGFRPARDFTVTLTYRAIVERWVETL